MANFFSFSRNQGVIIITLLFVLLLGGIYFFKYIPYNQRILEEKRYRGLENIEANVHAKIDNSVALLNNLLIAYQRNVPEYNHERLARYIAGYSHQNFTLLPVSTVTAGSADSVCTVNFDQDGLVISLRKGISRIGLKYSLSQFVDSLLPRDIFDGYILLKPEKLNDKLTQKIIYQTFPTGITAINTDSLNTDKSAFAAGKVKDILLSGNIYKIFPQQMSLKGDSVLTIAGLLNNKFYQKERRKLPENVVLTLLVFAAATVLALPWIKLYQMGNQDRLTVTDGISSFLIAMLLLSLLFFIFMRYNKSLQNSDISSDLIGRQISQHIETSFMQEVNSAYQALGQIDELKKASKIPSSYLSFGSVTSGAVPDQRNTVPGSMDLVRKLKTITAKLDINQVYWLKNNGDEAANWSQSADIPPHGNFGGRSYFKALKSNNSFYLKLPGGQPFYLEQVISYTTGQFTTILSKPSINPGTPIAAISFNLKCLNKPVMPAGFLYCIIDRQGKVLYHKDTPRNLNENLFEEFTQTDPLKAAIDTHGDAFFSTQYSGKNYYVSIKSIAVLPYQIVILEDKSFEDIRNVNTSSFNFVMWFGFFLILMIQLVILFYISQQTSFFKKQYFDISWIGPNEKFYQQYNLAVFWNVINIILLILFYQFSSFLQFLFILLISCTGLTLFLNCNYAFFYAKTAPEKYALKRNGNIALCIFLLIINIAAALLISMALFLLFEVVLGLLAWLSIKFRAKIQRYTRSIYVRFKSFTWDYSNSFSLMIFTRLIITSGLPVVLFYIASYNYELKMTSRYRHLQFTRDLIGKHPLLDSTIRFNDIYMDGIWISRPLFNVQKPAFDPSAEEQNTALLFKFLANYNTRLPGVDEYHADPTYDFIFYSRLLDERRNISFHLLPTGKYLEIRSWPLRYNMPVAVFSTRWKLELIRRIFFFFALVVFAIILHHIVRKLFALNLPSTTNWNAIDQVMLSDDRLNSLLFIIGAPGSGKLKALQKSLDQRKISPKDVFIADMILIPDSDQQAAADVEWLALTDQALHQKYALVIVNHFEYDIKNPATNRIKLNFIEALLQRNKSKVVIISTVHPVNFLDSLNQQTAAAAQGDRSPEHDLERWHVLLGHFRIVIHQLETLEADLPAKAALWEKVLTRETESSHFLQKMQQPVIDALKTFTGAKEASLDGDSLAFKLQVTSHYFYMYLWQSLTKEEKFLLYDLAEDGLVNPYDDYNLTLLISKGLIMREGGKLRLFNKGFRNFILTAIGNSEAMEIRKQITDNGNWKSLKTPLLILIVAVIVFLFASQQEAYATVIKYLGIVSIAVPGVLKFLSVFNSDSGGAKT